MSVRVLPGRAARGAVLSATMSAVFVAIGGQALPEGAATAAPVSSAQVCARLSVAEVEKVAGFKVTEVAEVSSAAVEPGGIIIGCSYTQVLPASSSAEPRGVTVDVLRSPTSATPMPSDAPNGWAHAKWTAATAKAEFEHARSKQFGDGVPVSGSAIPVEWAIDTSALWALDGVLVLNIGGVTKADDIKLMTQLVLRV